MSKSKQEEEELAAAYDEGWRAGYSVGYDEGWHRGKEEQEPKLDEMEWVSHPVNLSTGPTTDLSPPNRFDEPQKP